MQIPKPHTLVPASRDRSLLYGAPRPPGCSLYVIEEAEANLFAKYSIAPVPLIHVLKLQDGYDVARVFVTTDDAGYNCYSYYQKWLQFGPQNYTDFEIRLLRLFKIAA